MNSISFAALRNFFVRPILPDLLSQKFQEGELIQGRIIQAMPKKDLFVLRTKSVNLVAQSKIALFAGDKIIGKVIKNQSQVELKLIEVNGNPIHQKMSISSEEINYAQVPLPELYFGKKSFLEVYPDKENGRDKENSQDQESVCLIINSSLFNQLALDLKYSKKELTGKIWVENSGLREYLTENKPELIDFLIDEKIQNVDLKIFDMQRDIGSFRRQWTGVSNLDLRA